MDLRGSAPSALPSPLSGISTSRCCSSVGVMDALSVAVHDAAVGAVGEWTKAAVLSLSQEEPQQRQAHDAAVEFTKACVLRGVTHATAATLSEAWIREGLAHSTSGTALAIHAEDSGDCIENTGCIEAVECGDGVPNAKEAVGSVDVSQDTPRVSIEAVQSLASAVTAHAVQSALSQVMTMLMEQASPSLTRPDPPQETAAPPTLARAPLGEAACFRTADFEVADANPASTDVVDDSEDHSLTSPQAALSDAVVEAASRYVTTLLDSALIHRQHNGRPCPLPPIEVDEAAAPLLVRTPTPPPEPKPALRPHVEIATQRLTTPEQPVVELAAVRPPKTGARSRTKKPPPSLVSPPPPTTSETHTKPRAQRASPTKAPAEDEEPPRLRKLEEYLALHPVDRAKKIYRPQQPPRQQLPLLKSPSGYVAETDDSDDDDQELELLQHKPRTMKKLRPAPTFPPRATSPSKVKPPPALKPVDRPERLGLLNKPKKRSGFCQQCTFEGRSCKISDCIKHQPLR